MDQKLLQKIGRLGDIVVIIPNPEREDARFTVLRLARSAMPEVSLEDVCGLVHCDCPVDGTRELYALVTEQETD